LVLLALLVERILAGMAFDTLAHASGKPHRRAISHGSPRRRLFGHQRVGWANPAATEDDRRFLRHVGGVLEAQSDLVKRSVTIVAESRELLAKVSDLLRG
jgi:hypothetical protein